jgi:hypothetical protein
MKRLRLLKSILVRVPARARAPLRRSGARDTLTILAVGIVSFAIVEYWDLPDHIFSFLLAHADWQIDDMAITMIVVGMATLFLYARRLRELSHEIRARALADTSELEFLRQNGYTEGQGFLFSKAVPANEVAGLLRLRSGAAAATG